MAVRKALPPGTAAARPRGTGGGGVAGAVGHVVERELSRLFLVIGFWAGWLVALGLAALLRLAWPGWWTAVWVLAAGAAVAGLDVHLCHRRTSFLGRYMAALTHLVGAVWLAWVAVWGFHQATVEMWLIGGGTAAYLWTHWVHIRANQESSNLGDLFTTEDAEQAGIPKMKVLSMKVGQGGRKMTARLKLGAGVLQDHAIKATPAMDAHAALPVGSVVMNRDLDDASVVNMTISDPRTLRKAPLPWPGPYRPGASIAEALHMGSYQDATPVLYKILNHHLLIMGMTGAGKTFGWCWMELAETFTRRDAVVVLADITKGEQTVAPLRAGLHRCETSVDGAVGLLAGVHRAVRARTDWLGQHGYQSWREGCGLSHLTVWLEEAPKIIAKLTSKQLDDWVDDITAARSAGIRFVFSCQRADFTQLPTLVRGQMASACFGVAKPDDAGFGLSATQREHDCSPELWQAKFPGMFYLDAPGQDQPEEYQVMAARSFFWGKDEEAFRLMTEHVNRYNAATRPLDKVTASALAMPFVPDKRVGGAQAATATLDRPPGRPLEPGTGGGRPGEEDDMDGSTKEWLAAQLRGMGVNPDLPLGEEVDLPEDRPDGADDPLVYDPDNPLHTARFDEEPGNGARMSPDAAMTLIRSQLQQWKTAEGRTTFDVGDLAELVVRTGRQRTWVYGVLEKLETSREITRLQTSPVSWAIGEVDL